VESNQVVLSLLLTHRKTGKELCVATTHLKARAGDLLTSMRNEQGKDILDWLQTTRESRPVIISGDFNADPGEPVYSTMTGSIWWTGEKGGVHHLEDQGDRRAEEDS
jgi:nocturnin